MRHSCVVTDAEATVVGGALALAGVAMTLVYTAWRDRRKDQADEGRVRDQAVAELLTATADLMSGIQALRAGYDRSRWRYRIRTVARVWSALSAAFADERGFMTWATLGEISRRSAFIDRLLVVDDGLTEQQRVIASDIAGTMLPRTSRFFAAVAVLTLGRDEDLAEAVRTMTPAVTTLLEATGTKDRRYGRARADAEEALGQFRAFVDTRRRRSRSKRRPNGRH
jgi:hypothetical protein